MSRRPPFRGAAHALRACLAGAAAALCLAAPQALARQADPLADALRDALLLGCVPVATGQSSLTPDSKAVLDAAGFELGAPKSVSVDELAALQSGIAGGASFASRAVGEGAVVLADLSQARMCRIAVFGIDPAAARAAIKAELTAEGAPWVRQGGQETDAFAVDAYVWTIKEVGWRVLANVSGPKRPVNDGAGLQLLITVAVIG